MRLLARIKRMLAKVVMVIEFCHECGIQQPIVWTADDVLWAEIMGGPAGVLCPSCFSRKCEQRGMFLRWRPTVE